MRVKVAIIGLGIMGRRMLKHMRLHPDFQPDFLWDPNQDSCKQAIECDPRSKIMHTASDAMKAADLVYLACPPVARKIYALEAAKYGKSLFLEKPLGVDITESKDLVKKLSKYKTPVAVNFTQAAGIALSDLLKVKKKGELGSLVGVDIIVTYPKWPREWQKEADWLRYREEGGMTREVISHFLFFSERLFGPLKIIWAKTSYPENNLLCETDILARLESSDNCPVNILGSIGGMQADRQEMTIKGSKKSRRISEFYKEYESIGKDFTLVRAEPEDPRAVSLKSQLDDLSLHIKSMPNRLATIEEALRIQILVETILENNPTLQ